MSTNPWFNRFLDNTQSQLPGAALRAIQVELVNVAEELLNLSAAWQETVRVRVRQGRTTASLAADTAGARVARLIALVGDNGISVAAALQNDGDLLLRDEAPADATLEATISLLPGPVTDERPYPVLPDWMWQRETEAMVHGVLGRMMGQRGKPYTSTQMAAYHMRMFSRMAADLRVRTATGNLQGGQAWSYPQDFQVRRKR